MNCVEEAVDRVERYLRNYDTDQPAEILTDIMHYCKLKGLDLSEQLDIAESYYYEELSVLEEIAE